MSVLAGLKPYTGAIEKVTAIVDKVVPDGDMRAELRAQLAMADLEARREFEALYARLAEADSKSESVLTRNCRPIMCFWLAGLFTAYCFGWTPKITPALGETFMTGIFSIMGIYTGLRSLVDKPVSKGAGVFGAFRRG